ncbi:uncharacterized protein MYCFIDRAFT_175054 [Pseudocercospora fijiensis CIRAD86]|uniref:Uncharacterized protein n=1 Tax=Pseudocercospora fijiensis (strain CIRAD86) TaxID=383855 RepID=M3B2K1_PSEFD|nr:uncharacterized protein MYCFIDRAFT_175054 [Pseudocercospora fijiensis CIRAD86]EME83627.1 hypothetical protein MYCFIDRAFT_175054 [Pseudocercospora fijiensis CIRAD86]
MLGASTVDNRTIAYKSRILFTHAQSIVNAANLIFDHSLTLLICPTFTYPDLASFIRGDFTQHLARALWHQIDTRTESRAPPQPPLPTAANMGAVLGRPGLPLAALAALFSGFGNTPRLDAPQYLLSSSQSSFWPSLPPAPARSDGGDVHNATSQGLMVATSGPDLNHGNVSWVFSPHPSVFIQVALLILARLAPNTPLVTYINRAHSVILLVALAVQYCPGLVFSLIQDGIVQLLIAVGIALWQIWRNPAVEYTIDEDIQDETKASDNNLLQNSAVGQSEDKSTQFPEQAPTTPVEDNQTILRQNEALRLELLEAKKKQECQATKDLEEIITLKAKLKAECKKHGMARNDLGIWKARAEKAEDKLKLAELAGETLEARRMKKFAVQDEISALHKQRARVAITANLEEQLAEAREALVRTIFTTHESAQKNELVSEVKELSKRLATAKADELHAAQKVLKLQGKQDTGTQTDNHTSPESTSSSATSTTLEASQSTSHKPKTILEALINPESSRSNTISALPPSTRDTPSIADAPSGFVPPFSSQEQGEDHQMSTTSALHSPEPLANAAEPNTHSSNPELSKLLAFFKANPAPELPPISPAEPDTPPNGSIGNVESVLPVTDKKHAAQSLPKEDQTSDAFLPMRSALLNSKTVPETPPRTSGSATDSESSLPIAVLENAQSVADSFSSSSNADPPRAGATDSVSSLTSMPSVSSNPSAEDHTSSNPPVQPTVSEKKHESSTKAASGAVASDAAPSPAAPSSKRSVSSLSSSTTLPSTSNPSSGIPGLFRRSEQSAPVENPTLPRLCFYRPHIKAVTRKRCIRKENQTFPCVNGKKCVGDPSQYDQSTGKLINLGDPDASLYGGSSDEAESARRFTAWNLQLCHECYVEVDPPIEVAKEKEAAEESRSDEEADGDAGLDEQLSGNETNAGGEATREQEEEADKPQINEDQDVDDGFDEEVYGNESKTGEEATHEQECGEKEEQEPGEDPEGDAFEAALKAEFAVQYAEDAKAKEKTEEEQREEGETEEGETEPTAGEPQMASNDVSALVDPTEAMNLTGAGTGPVMMADRPDPSVYQNPGMTEDEAFQRAVYQLYRHGPISG